MTPIPKVTDVDRAFPTSRALGASLPGFDVIPPEFGTLTSFGHTKWNRLFNAVFVHAGRMSWKRFGLLPKEGVVAADAWRALEVLLGVRDIKHEHKEAAWAFLASEWFADCRWEISGVGEVPFDDAELDAAWCERNPR